ncbi:peptide chain release factor N(5)-glutamine methyltransferase [Desulfopila sp. IMCC35008]|uniref:peptide chain release factor N(5)-glutamine methyltransferase n=1 Tax=Desulfopila sp. IMCC35008 TaxID=2653858 RepID=UPI0013D242D0|nr:peptide chain release factor N(5)-glutamine methyltransferase [Desulfopila sp. IMCC35008]
MALLTEANIPDCRSDVFLLLGHVLEKSRTGLLAAGGEQVDAVSEAIFRNLLDRRLQREPVAYIIGEQEFWSLDFMVNRKVLIPRPETEFLLERVISHVKNRSIPAGRFIDLCCGSGVISIVLALELACSVEAVDISAGALQVTRDNCLRHGVDNQVRLICSDLTSCFHSERDVALVVSNPPYVSRRAIRDELEPEVARFEPRLALDGGEEGLDLVRRIRVDLPRILKPGGVVMMEIGFDQGDAVKSLFQTGIEGTPSFNEVEILRDYSGRDRVLSAVIE